MRKILLLVGLALLLAGCTAPQSADREDPGTDRLGYHDGYWHDDELPFDTDGSLNATERRAVVARAMARVERIREVNFDRNVDVRIVNRSQYLANRTNVVERAHSRWNNQVWEGLFVVGEDRDVTDVFNRTFGQSVAGYYSPETDEIVVVSDGPRASLRPGTLSHELTHALQDQQFGLGRDPSTQDGQLGWLGLVEGEANTVQSEYLGRCGAAWACVDGSASGGGGGTVDQGVFLVIYQPYAIGPDFVEALRERDDWAAVDRAHEDPPASSEQIIHPERYPEDEPEDVTVPDRSTTDWERSDHDPVGDTVGETSIYVTFLVNDVVSSDGGRLSYRHPVSTGWAGDRLVPYKNGQHDGYVWQVEWETSADAEAFHQAYRELLAVHDAERRSDGVYVIPEPSPFADAFRVERDGRTVRIVNGPDVDSLSAIHGR